MAGKKRKHQDEHGDGSVDALYSNKARNRPSADAPINPTYGQRCAIPGLEDVTAMEGDEDELNHGGEMDALAYLKAVRHEASGIPNLLVAPRSPPSTAGRDIYENGDGDFRGYYNDGAYVASSMPAQAGSDQSEAEELDQLVRYFDSIIARYKTLKAQLQQMPPLEAIQSLGPDHPTHVGKLKVPVAGWWKWKMRDTDPKPAQVASMDKTTVLRLIGLLARGTTLARGAEVEVGVSRWVWSLLAKLPDRGELTSEEIGVVRDLGKKAVLIGMGLRQKSNWEQGMKEVERDFDDEEVDDYEEVANQDEIPLDSDDVDEIFDGTETNEQVSNDDLAMEDSFIGPQLPMSGNNSMADEDAPIEVGSSGGVPATEEYPAPSSFEEVSQLSSQSSDESAALEAARARLLDQIDQEKFQAEQQKQAKLWNTRATVDMVITVAGEIYGQRDLLEFRGAWDE